MDHHFPCLNDEQMSSKVVVSAPTSQSSFLFRSQKAVLPPKPLQGTGFAQTDQKNEATLRRALMELNLMCRLTAIFLDVVVVFLSFFFGLYLKVKIDGTDTKR